MKFGNFAYITPVDEKYKVETPTTTRYLTVHEIIDIASKDKEGIKYLLTYILVEHLEEDEIIKFHKLVKANLRWANLKNADLKGANLSGADLKGADSRWAKFWRGD